MPASISILDEEGNEIIIDCLELDGAIKVVGHLYEWTKHSVNDEESALLHSCPLEEILTWTKAHLDAFLATAEVILEQNVDPG